MADYKPPLAIYFIWHPADSDAVKPYVEHCSKMLQRDVNKPFSRAMNLPVFYRTSLTIARPRVIESLSKKSLLFVFVSTEFAANDLWVEYVKSFLQTDGFSLIPIALDVASLSLGKDLRNLNFIRAFEYPRTHQIELLFISIAHEIYRFALNENFNELSVGNDNAIDLFLSHSKKDSWAVNLAKSLKQEIDNSVMRNFFDANDIAPGYRFDDEIIKHISNSTIISIHSDAYSSRYWCQRELLTAKDKARPIVAVDYLNAYEDRRFPYSANIPAIHLDVKPEVTRVQILSILSAALLETLRYYYNKTLLKAYSDGGWYGENVLQLTRPPEVADLNRLFDYSNGKIESIFAEVVYPEPPVHTEELAFLTKLNVIAHTPLTIDKLQLTEHSIGISISDPAEEELVDIGLGNNQLIQLSQDMSRHLLARGSRVVYGGDLRENGFTEFILEEATTLQSRLKTENIFVDNYIAWPIYNSDNAQFKAWKVRFRQVAEMKKIEPPNDVAALILNKDAFVAPNNPENAYVWSRCLTHMRQLMIKNCTARICAGGKNFGYKGKMPGVLEEIIIAIEEGKSIYLLGGFGGVTAKVCDLLLRKDIPIELTEWWQIEHNSGYASMIEFAKTKGAQYAPDYENITNAIKNADLKNGLTIDDNQRLFKTIFVDEALHLVIKGLKNLSEVGTFF